jgi:DNA-binding transcriptional ArsR family regulator
VVNSQTADRLDAVFAAVADPTRRAIVADLARGARTTGELAEPHAMSLPAVSKHLSVLERAGLVSRKRQGRNQVYELRPQPLSEAAQWLNRYHRFWTERIDTLTDYLEKS